MVSSKPKNKTQANVRHFFPLKFISVFPNFQTLEDFKYSHYQLKNVRKMQQFVHFKAHVGIVKVLRINYPYSKLVILTEIISLFIFACYTQFDILGDLQ